MLGRAERALGHLTGTLRAAGKQVSKDLIITPLLRREAISSSRIEGTNTTPEQLVLLELEARDTEPSRDLSDTQEVLNYLTALNHGFDRLREIPVCLRLLQELHEVLMRNVRGDAERPGEFRTVQNFIGSSQDIRQARFVPPPVPDMRRCLEELEKYMNGAEDMLPHLVRIALVHYQFEAIHPFRDGNGRVGRLIVPLLLCSYERLEELPRRGGVETISNVCRLTDRITGDSDPSDDLRAVDSEEVRPAGVAETSPPVPGRRVLR